jgi:hypothetical protein
VTSQNHPRRHPDTAFRPVGDEGGLVVLSEKSEVKVLNPVAIKVFGLLNGEHSTEQIASMVAEEFEVSKEEALKDVNSFLDELKSHGMLA